MLAASIAPLGLLELLHHADLLGDADWFYLVWNLCSAAFVAAVPVLSLITLRHQRRARRGLGERLGWRPLGIVQAVLWLFWLLELYNLCWLLAIVLVVSALLGRF